MTHPWAHRRAWFWRILVRSYAPARIQAGLAALGLLLTFPALASASEPLPAGIFDVCAFGATGNGTTLDTPAIQKAIDARPLPAWGFSARNVGRLELDNVRLRLDQAELRPVLLAENVETLVLDALSFPTVPAVTSPLILTNVVHVERRDGGTADSPVHAPGH